MKQRPRIHSTESQKKMTKCNGGRECYRQCAAHAVPPMTDNPGKTCLRGVDEDRPAPVEDLA